MNSEIVVGLLSLAGTLIGAFAGIMTSSKLSNYRISQLEKKVDKHNTLIERMALAENNIKDMQGDISEIKDDIKEHTA